MIRRLICAIVLCLFPFLSEAAGDSVTLQLKWKHQFQFAGFYMAAEKGFYHDAGFQVEIRAGEVGKVPADELIHGHADYVVADPGILLARAKGAPVKVLAAIFQHSPLTLIVRENSGITRFSDLRGKRIMLVPGLNADIEAALGAAGITADDFTRQDTSFDIRDLVNGNTDAFAGYETDQPHQLRLMGVRSRIIHPREEGIDFYGDVLVTSEQNITEQPEKVKAFTQASMRGWQYALDHIDETIDVIKEKYNDQDLSRKQLVFEAQKTKEMIESDVVQIGYMREQRWVDIADIYITQGLLPADFPASEVIYLPDESFLDVIKEHRWLIGIILLALISILLTLHSISLRRAVQVRTAKLKESEERFRELFERNKCVELIIDPDNGEIVEANHAAAVFYGYNREQLLALNISAINTFANDQIHEEMALARLAKRDHFIFKHRLSNGEIRDVEVYSGPIVWKQKQLLYSIVHDVSSRKQAEAKATALNNILEESLNEIYIFDAETLKFIQVNYGGRLNLDFDLDELRELTPVDITPEIDQQAFMALLEPLRSGEQRKIQFSTVHQRKDGSRYPVRVHLQLSALQSKQVFVAVVLDVTELEDMEQRFRQAQKMEAVGTLVGGIAHDFNNMLAGMTGNLYLAKQRSQGQPAVIQSLDNIEKLSFRASDMIHQLLTFARKDQVSMNAIALNPFMKETIKFLRASLPENIDLVHDLCSEALTVNGDITQLHQIMMNLVNNARDALDGIDRPQIKIKLNLFVPDDEFMRVHTYFNISPYALISVDDNGCGIPDRQIEHLFEPFFTTKEQGKGTGLGLAMVFGAVKTHQGYVRVNSVEGKGSIFSIYIPLIDAEDDTQKSRRDQEVVKGNGEMILIVDDEQQIVSTEREVLESLGYQVLTASDGDQAVEAFKQHADKLDLVILDVVMPRMGGIEASQCMRLINPQVKIIFSTGYDKDNDGKLKNETVLSKPYMIEDLSHLLQQQLNT
ncbi:two-component system, sporulation sensor kinase E [Mariprofundus micogutta]|uniref:histidine kinase n=1 Tax=Mariprofundus micogutta TaxID=1921010 RepID=A0A1L8CNU4_9PROT|nr:two-component system, sporulation sensor kinase E [Mariprofundus micogutta]